MSNQRGDTSRRDFLVRAAGVGGAAAAVGAWGNAPLRGLARDRASLGADEPIRVGVIGTGGMGTGHCRSLANLGKDGAENIRIDAVCDVCEPRMDAAADAIAEIQGSRPDTYVRHEDLLARDDIHGVLVATVEHWHAPICADAVQAGKDVYVEKPMTLRLNEAVRLREVVQANPGVVFQVGTQKMMLPKWQAARELVREGAIGKPTFSQTSYCRNSMDGEWLYYAMDPAWKPGENLDWDRWCSPLGAAPWDPAVYARWRRYRRYSTGIIGDLLVHQMTPLMYAVDAGWPTRVTAAAGHYVDKVMENHDQININIEFENGHTMIVAGSTSNAVGLETIIRGHEANLYLGGRHCELRPERIYADDVDPRRVDCEDIGNDQDQLRLNWLRCIRSREAPASPIDLATQVMVVVDLATRSAWDGAAYAFDPKTLRARRV